MQELSTFFPEAEISEAKRTNCIGYEHKNVYTHRLEHTTYFRGEMLNDSAEMEDFLYEEYVNEHN